MKRNLILWSAFALVLLVGVVSASPGNYSKNITLNHSLVTGSDQSNFPVLISITDNDLRTVADGGHVQNANGYDIIFTDTSNNSLSSETEDYNASTGQLNAWVKVQTLSASIDTNIKIWYGNSSISTVQANSADVWSNGFTAVYHMNEVNSLVSDSTINGYNLNIHGTPSVVSGKINNALYFDGNITNYATANFTTPDTGTVEAFISDPNTGASNGNYLIRCGPCNYEIGDWGLLFVMGGTTLPSGVEKANTVGTRYYATTFNGSAATVYVDSTTLQSNQNYSGGSSVLMLGVSSYDEAGTSVTNQTIDELRVSSVVRSSDWIKTGYSIMNYPAYFVTEGSENNYTIIPETPVTPVTPEKTPATAFSIYEIVFGLIILAIFIMILWQLPKVIMYGDLKSLLAVSGIALVSLVIIIAAYIAISEISSIG